MRKKIGMITVGIIFLTVLLSSCDGNISQSDDTSDKQTLQSVQSQIAEPTMQEETTQEEITQEEPQTPIRFYIYNQNSGTRKITGDYTGPWIKGKDIQSFEVYAADEDTISDVNFKALWEKYWNQMPNHDSYKIGYNLTFKINSSEVISKTITKPDDVTDFFDYIEVYLYDDINQVQGQWYSHILMSQITDKTVLTSIKLTAGSKIDEVSDISLKVFIYNSDKDFDSNGDYVGKNSYSIKVIKGN